MYVYVYVCMYVYVSRRDLQCSGLYVPNTHARTQTHTHTHTHAHTHTHTLCKNASAALTHANTPLAMPTPSRSDHRRLSARPSRRRDGGAEAAPVREPRPTKHLDCDPERARVQIFTRRRNSSRNDRANIASTGSMQTRCRERCAATPWAHSKTYGLDAEIAASPRLEHPSKHADSVP